MSDVTPPAEPGTTLRELFTTILRRLALVTAAVTVVAAVVGLLVAQTSGLWGALLGGGIGLLFCATTVATMAFGEGRSPQFLAIAVLGGWLAKMVVIIVVLAIIRGMDFYDRYVLAATLGVLVVASLVVEMLAVRSARIPLVTVPASTTPSSTQAPPS